MASAEQYTYEIQKKRLDKEVQMLEHVSPNIVTSHKKSSFGLIIRVELQSQLLTGLPFTSFYYDIHLEGKYPFQSPKILCETSFPFPSLSDGRDLLSSIIKRKWTPSITSLDVINALPAFTAELYQKWTEGLQADIGVFHLGHPMPLEIWENKEGMKCFMCVEIDINDDRNTKEKVMVVTNLVILQLDVNPDFPMIGYLTNWATLPSLNAINRSRSDRNVLVFDWKEMEDIPACSQKFNFSGSEECIQLITQNIHKLSTIIKKQNKKTLQEEEVKPEHIKHMHIDDIIKNISEYENKLLKGTVNIEIINSLVNFYQQAIEYFSAMNDEKFQEFLNKMHKLLSHQLIQDVMQGRISEVSGVGVFEEEKVEEEEVMKVLEEDKKEVELEELDSEHKNEDQQ